MMICKKHISELLGIHQISGMYTQSARGLRGHAYTKREADQHFFQLPLTTSRVFSLRLVIL